MSTSHPRLLQIFNRTIGGGGEDVAVEHMRRLLTARCVFHECLFESDDWTGPEAPAVSRQALWLLHNNQALEQILTAHRKLRADAWIVHNWVPVVSAGIYAAARRAGVPIIQFIHNFRPFSVTGYLWVEQNLSVRKWRRNFLREVAAGSWQHSRLKTAWLAFVLASLHWRGHFEAVKAWIAVSEFMRDQFVDAGLPPSMVFTLRHSWIPLMQPQQNAEGNHYLFLGRLIEEKGVRVLMDAWEMVAHRAGAKAPRLLIGGDGPLAECVSEAARRNPLLEYCGVIRGETKQSLLAGCRALIIPSIWREPLGLVVYEAFDHARPVLAARSGGLTELVQPGKTGLLHTPGNAAELADHVLRLEREFEERQRFGRAGREWLLANTAEDQWWHQLLEIVDRTVRIPRSGSVTGSKVM
jgi:glycosyltransferase involved in cell wall biosynthesis